nr:hypothetical protein [Pseudomonas sp. BIGb0427]
MRHLPTLPAGSNDGRVVNSAFVQQELAAERGSAAPLMDGVAAAGVAVKKAREDHRHPTDTSRRRWHHRCLPVCPACPRQQSAPRATRRRA